MHKSKILYFSSFGSLKGGGQKSLLLLFEQINKGSYTPICVTPEKGTFTDKLKEIGVRNYVVPMGATKSINIPRIISSIRQIYKIIKRENIDIIHTDGPRNTFYAGIAAKISKKPVITHIRVVDEPGFDDKIMAMLTDHFIFVSEAAKKRFTWINDKKTSNIIYNGIDVEPFEKYRTSANFSSNKMKKYTIGCIGRVEKAKGQIYLIRAAKKVLQKYPDCSFVFIGETEKEYFEHLLEEASTIKESIKFTGYTNDPYVIMKGIDIIVHPSLSEGFSRVILESMAMKKPIIATDVGGNPEAIIEGQTGFLIRSRDPDAISAKIIDLLESRVKRIEMGEKGYQRVNDLFRLELQLNKMEDIYSRLVTN
ncbi:glycosyltransferase [Thermodesulfobacteriota bacterium]